ncbi:spermatogenesis associated 2-like isoform X1 [Centroberyx gerrardi]
MMEMSVLGQRARELVNKYDLTLEQRIVGGGSNLVCKDEELWRQVERLLKDGDAEDTHCLGLDPLQVMEESLKAAAAPPTAAAAAAPGGRARARGGLKGLAKAFEVLEQAALNLYLGPWREEYKVVKMYSGMFTHYIKPVLSMPQILNLFGLLGYQSCSARHEQLRRQATGVSSASTGDLLHLSCAFFLARCECRLLLSASGRHGGEAEWELSLVRERQRGRSLQVSPPVALDNTKKMLEVNQPLKEDLLELSGIDGELDLYTAEEVNSRRREALVDDAESPRSLSWVGHSSSLPPAIATHSNGVTSPFSSTTSPPTDPVCVSTLNYQLTKMSTLASNTARNFSAAAKQDGHPYEESTKLGFDRADSQLRSLTAQAMGICKSEASSPYEAIHFCNCVQSHSLCVKHCIDCNTLHSLTCGLLKNCQKNGHSLVLPDKTVEEMRETRSVSPQKGSLREGGMSLSPTHVTSSTAVSCSALRDGPGSISHSPQPIPYHDCCDLAHPDPKFTCVSCWIFHSGTCKGVEFCQQQRHEIQPLGVCSCGRPCSRKPLVLCRYCGAEYCNDCWYRNPVECACGQTFDQSSSV